MKYFTILFFINLVGGCAVFTEKIYMAYPMKYQPDYSCRLGNGESGIMYYLWECYEEKRIIIYNRGSGLYWSSNHREVGECGIKTTYEIKNELEIKNKSSCYSLFPFPYRTSPPIYSVAKLVEEHDLSECDYIGEFVSTKDFKDEAIQDIEQQLTNAQAHAYTEPIFHKRIINEDLWVSKGYVCYHWNK